MGDSPELIVGFLRPMQLAAVREIPVPGDVDLSLVAGPPEGGTANGLQAGP